MSEQLQTVKPVETVGTSPKAIWGPLAAALAALAARAIADATGITVEQEWLEGLILAGIAAIAGFVAARIAKPGKVLVAKPVQGTSGFSGTVTSVVKGQPGERGDAQTVFIIVGAFCGILALVLLLA